MAVQTAPIRVIRIKADYLRLKRALDITFTLLVSPFVLLVGILIAICIKLDSKGPVFFRQKRVGQHGEEFEMFKFRSMYTDSDPKVHEKRVAAMMINGETLTKDENDPRITRIGRFIRKTSLDELPQFWNVLKGEMTLVGPRPPLPYEVELYRERDWLRLSGRPGLTGAWQVYGRSSVTFENMVDMDIEYLSDQSLWKDIKLIISTVPVMIRGRGAA
jgi:lipopolysaccharide/colanic/teichoic acid biosynthesis glycosyltransferase